MKTPRPFSVSPASLLRRTTPRGPRNGSRRLRILLALLIGSVVLSGCNFDVYSLPLPGGTDTGDNPMTVTVEFRDVLDLVPKSTVKVNDVSVGKVTDIELDGDQAKVTVEVRNDTELPADAVAKIRQTSLLGEKFVSLEPPADGGSSELLADGDLIPIERTSRNPEVEEVLGALSLLLNGGGVAQLKTIAQEINLTLDGREGSARSVLTQIDSFTGQLADNKGKIVNAIESINRLAVSVKQQQRSIDGALEQLPSALDSIDRQRDDLIKMLKALDRLSGVGVRVINRSKQATIESVRQLQPVLTQLANSGDDFVNAFNVFLTYPFVDEVVGRDPQVARNLHQGDFTNLSVELDLDLLNPGDLPGIPCTPLSEIPPAGPLPPLDELCQQAQDVIGQCVNQQTVPACAGLPASVLGLVCDLLPVPIPIVCPGGRQGNGGNGGIGGPGLPHLPGLPGLPDLPGLLGLNGNTGSPLGGLLNRPGFNASQRRGPTYAQLMKVFDPALVTLLTPGMVLR